MLNENFTFTKRQLGFVLLIGGILGFIAIIGVDVVQAGREGGIGPAQLFALGIMALVALIGLTLIPLGDDPA